MAFWQNREFKRLYQVWEEKLRESQFDDAEEGSLDGRVLKQKASNVYRAAPDVIRETKEAYFDLLSEHIQEYPFQRSIDRDILSLRTQGLKICEIAAKLDAKKQGRHPKTIRSVIRHYENLWGIRKWLPNQIKPQPKKK